MNSATIVLDTDIGTDVDDSIALLQLITSDTKFDSLLVTTTYGDTPKRANIASTYIALAGKSFPVIAGNKKPMSNRNIFESGLEGQQISEFISTNISSKSFIDVMKSLIDEKVSISLLAIGPLTNIAELILTFPNFESCVDHIYLMGGNFKENRAEHNFISDIEATRIVFNSGIAITAVGIDATETLKIKLSELPKISTSAVLSTLITEIELWCKYRNADFLVPHDSLAIMMMSHPNWFSFSEPGLISVNEYGISTFEAKPSGRHRYVKSFDNLLVKNFIVSTLNALGKVQ